jgi:hypothetical protein
MHVELDADEIASLCEALDCLQTKFAFLKGATYAERTERIIKAEALELKLRQALSARDS